MFRIPPSGSEARERMIAEHRACAELAHRDLLDGRQWGTRRALHLDRMPLVGDRPVAQLVVVLAPSTIAAVWAAKILVRAARPIFEASASEDRRSTTSRVVSARMISRAGTNRVSIPSHRSEITGVAQDAASKSRTDGDQPASIISARVTFSV